MGDDEYDSNKSCDNGSSYNSDRDLSDNEAQLQARRKAPHVIVSDSSEDEASKKNAPWLVLSPTLSIWSWNQAPHSLYQLQLVLKQRSRVWLWSWMRMRKRLDKNRDNVLSALLHYKSLYPVMCLRLAPTISSRQVWLQHQGTPIIYFCSQDCIWLHWVGPPLLLLIKSFSRHLSWCACTWKFTHNTPSSYAHYVILDCFCPISIDMLPQMPTAFPNWVRRRRRHASTLSLTKWTRVSPRPNWKQLSRKKSNKCWV